MDRIDEQAKANKADFESTKVDLEERIRALQDYLSKYNKLQSMYNNLNKDLGKTKNIFSEYSA